MTFTQLHFEKIWILFACGFVSDLGSVRDLNRVRGIKPDDTVIVDVYRGYAVGSCSEKECFVKADLAWSWLDISIPIDGSVSQTDVPFADEPGSVPGLLEDGCDGWLLPLDQKLRIAWENLDSISPPGVTAGEQRVAGRGTSRRITMRVREPETILRQLINVRGLYILRTVAAYVSIADIIRQDDDDVRWPLADRSAETACRRGACSGECQ